jgi:hypothetical protein
MIDTTTSYNPPIAVMQLSACPTSHEPQPHPHVGVILNQPTSAIKSRDVTLRAQPHTHPLIYHMWIVISACTTTSCTPGPHISGGVGLSRHYVNVLFRTHPDAPRSVRCVLCYVYSFTPSPHHPPPLLHPLFCITGVTCITSSLGHHNSLTQHRCGCLVSVSVSRSAFCRFAQGAEGHASFYCSTAAPATAAPVEPVRGSRPSVHARRGSRYRCVRVFG